MNTRLIRRRIKLFPLNSRLWIVGSNLRLPELERHIHPGKLLLTLLGKCDELWLRVDNEPDQPGSDHHVKQGVVDRSDIIVLKSLPGRKRHHKGCSGKCTTVVGARANAAVIQAHFTIIEGHGGTDGLNAIPREQARLCPASGQGLRDPIRRCLSHGLPLSSRCRHLGCWRNRCGLQRGFLLLPCWFLWQTAC